MIPSKVIKYVNCIDPNIKTDDIKELSGGFSSLAFKVNAKEPFVLLVQRDGAINKSSYGHAYVILNLLKNHNYKYSPTPLWLEPNQDAIAISFFDGKPSDQFDFNNSIKPLEMSYKVIDATLAATHIGWDEYIEYMRKSGLKPVAIRNLKDDSKEFGTGWLDIVKRSCPDKYIVEWLNNVIPNVVNQADQKRPTNPIFSHGDLSNPNILIQNDGKFIFIDWDSSRFRTYGLEFLIAYITSLTDFMKPHTQEIIKFTANKLGESAEIFQDKVHEANRFNDAIGVNWAAMMMAKVNSGEVPGDLTNFKKIALNRIDDYEKKFRLH